MGEKWLYSNVGWVYITPDGSLFEAGASNDGSDKLIYKFSSEFHQNPERLYDAYENSLRQQREQNEGDNLFAEIGSGSDGLLCGV